MINRALCVFLEKQYGPDVWDSILLISNLRKSDVLNISDHPRNLRRLLASASRHLCMTPSELLEDFGAWLVRLENVRRLLRFSGPEFTDFIYSLEDLPARAALIVSDVPDIRINVTLISNNEFEIKAVNMPAAWFSTMVGAVRGMADDYGVLTVITSSEGALKVRIAASKFGENRIFSLLEMLSGRKSAG